MVLFGCCFWPHFAAISVRFLPIMAILGVFTVILRFFIMFGNLECIKQICKSMQKYANSCQRKLCKIVQRHAPDKHAWSWLSLFSFFSALPVKLYNFSWIINLIQSCQATPTSICCGIEVSPDSWLSWLPETCCFESNFELHCAEIVVRLPLVPRMSILGRSKPARRCYRNNDSHCFNIDSMWGLKWFWESFLVDFWPYEGIFPRTETDKNGGWIGPWRVHSRDRELVRGYQLNCVINLNSVHKQRRDPECLTLFYYGQAHFLMELCLMKMPFFCQKLRVWLQ